MTGRIAQKRAMERNGSRKYTQPVRSFANRDRRAKTSADRQLQPFTMLLFDLRAAGCPLPARISYRIPRGFLEREANVKQTHR